MEGKFYEFEAVLLKHEGIDASFIEFPFNVEKEFGVKGQVKVKAWFDGHEYRGSLVKMGHHCHIIGVKKQIRKTISKTYGEIIHVKIIKDTDLRTVVIPIDLINSFKNNPIAEEVFNNLSYSHRKEYIQWLEDAKKQETREKRVIKIIDLLIAKLK